METKSTTRDNYYTYFPELNKESSLLSKNYMRRRSLQGPLFLDQNMKSSFDLISKCKEKKRRGSQELQKASGQSHHKNKSIMKSDYIEGVQLFMMREPTLLSGQLLLKDQHSRRSFNSEIEQKSIKLQDNSIKREEKIIKVQQTRKKNHIIIRPQHYQRSERDIPLSKSSQFQQKPKKSANQSSGSKTKNLLRNFANYNHQYILYNKQADKLIEKFIQNRICQFQEKNIESIKSDFQLFVRNRKMENFEQYKTEWSGKGIFHELYKFLSMKFYLEEAFCYIYRSKMTNKDIHIQYLNNFIMGILNPQSFNRFKKHQK